MILLPNGCRCSKLTVSPSNWDTKKATTEIPWRVTYRFYDNNGQLKQVPLKGMNHLHRLKDRQDFTKQVIDNEIRLLTQRAYNPITGHLSVNTSVDISPEVILPDALQFAFDNLEVSAGMKVSIESSLKYIQKAIVSLRLDVLAVSLIKPKHILAILKEVDRVRKLSPINYNHYRAYLLMLFKILFINGAVESNPVNDIPRRMVTRKIREILTKEERTKVDEHLKKAYPQFGRYCKIFFHSGGRSTELLSLKVGDVDLERQRFKVTIRKGAQAFETWKVIKTIALPLWKELLEGALPTQYVFSRAFSPGDKALKPLWVSHAWRNFVKEPLGIKVNFYAHKHAHTTEVASMLSTKEAAKHNSHKSEAMVIQIYDVEHQKRENEEIRELNNPY